MNEKPLFEYYEIKNGIFPPKLVDKIRIPLTDLDVKKPFLDPFVKKELIPEHLDCIVTSIFDYTQRIAGHIPLPWIELGQGPSAYFVNKTERTARQKASKIYGVDFQDLMVLDTQDTLDFWVIAHESLHQVFYNLPSETRAHLRKIAIKSFGTVDAIKRILPNSYVSYNPTLKPAVLKAIAKEEPNTDRHAYLVSLNNALEDVNVNSMNMLVTEYISYLLTSPSLFYTEGGFKEKTPSKMRDALLEVGFKIGDIPGPDRYTDAYKKIFYTEKLRDVSMELHHRKYEKSIIVSELKKLS